MSNKFVLDTSFLIAVLNPEDKHHEDAANTLQSLPESVRFILPGVVLVEISLFVERLMKGGENVLNFLEEVYDVVEIDRQYVKPFMNFVSSTNLPLKPNDYSVLHVSVKNNAKLLSFDGKLNKTYLKITNVL